jgi:hypothetical protein
VTELVRIADDPDRPDAPAGDVERQDVDDRAVRAVEDPAASCATSSASVTLPSIR